MIESKELDNPPEIFLISFLQLWEHKHFSTILSLFCNSPLRIASVCWSSNQPPLLQNTRLVRMWKESPNSYGVNSFCFNLFNTNLLVAIFRQSQGLHERIHQITSKQETFDLFKIFRKYEKWWLPKTLPNKEKSRYFK